MSHVNFPQKFFPAFRSVPSEYELDDTYYTDPSNNGSVTYKIHWCFIAEIIADVSFGRPVYKVRDRDGKETLVALYFDNSVAAAFDRKKYVVGNTICVMYAFQKVFMDGRAGVRVEEPNGIQGTIY